MKVFYIDFEIFVIHQIETPRHMYIYVSDVYKSNNLFLPWWQGGGGVGGVWIPPKSDDVIYEQPLTRGPNQPFRCLDYWYVDSAHSCEAGTVQPRGRAKYLMRLGGGSRIWAHNLCADAKQCNYQKIRKYQALGAAWLLTMSKEEISTWSTACEVRKSLPV